MCVLIVFVALLMNRQSQQREINTLSTSNVMDLAGFQSRFWYLPDDPLWGFVKIPGGDFLMGSNPAQDRMAYANERWSATRRQGTVALADFYIGKFEVTVAQFRAFAEEYPERANSVQANAVGSLPIANITWPEALAYGRWLEQKLKTSLDTPQELRNFLAAGGKVTLPTEAEWEKAARGPDGRIFSWGEQIATNFANYNSNSVLAVGSKPCNECMYGLQDMGGNVWELTSSPLHAYPYNPDDDLKNLSEDAIWVMRGGSFADSVANIRAAVRGGVDPGVRNSGIGFRLVITKP